MATVAADDIDVWLFTNGNVVELAKNSNFVGVVIAAVTIAVNIVAEVDDGIAKTDEFTKIE